MSAEGTVADHIGEDVAQASEWAERLSSKFMKARETISSVIFGGFFAYLALIPFIAIQEFHLGAADVGWLSALNGVALWTGALTNNRLSGRWPVRRLLRFSTGIALAAGFASLAACAALAAGALGDAGHTSTGLFLIVAPGEPLRLALALMVFAYLYSDRIRALDWSWLHRRPRTGQLVFGSIGGFFSGTVNLSMPPLLIYFMLLELAPTAMAQILNLCFFGGRLIQGVTLGLAGVALAAALKPPVSVHPSIW